MTAPQVPLENQENNQNQQNQNPDPNQNQSPDSGTPTQNIQPPNTNTVPREEFDRTLESTHNLYRQTLVEGETQRRNLQSQLDAANARLNSNQQPVVPDDQLTPAQ